MLRKCFPNNFKRTLMCNQDVLNAVDGSKYAIPDIKIKEALCEYGKYPYYLEHYFMTSKVDYKLKGKFNIRCLANLSTLPNVIKYLDTDEFKNEYGDALNGIQYSYNLKFESYTIDEQTGEAGFVTRLEAFVDMLFRKKRANIVNKLNLSKSESEYSPNVEYIETK